MGLAPKGQKAIEIWRSVGRNRGAVEQFPAWYGGRKSPTKVHLPGLLARLLIAFAREFDRESQVPMWLCATTLRVLGEPIAEREIARLTGTSPETRGIGWQVGPFVLMAAKPRVGRGNMLRLNACGLAAQGEYWRSVEKIENDCEDRLGAELVREVRRRLERLFRVRDQDGLLLIARGMISPKGVKRPGEQTASLGAREVGVAARKRVRELVAQSESFDVFQ